VSFTNDRRCATRHCSQATETRQSSLLAVACHTLNLIGPPLPGCNKFMWQTTRNSHHRQLPIRSHSTIHPTADSKLPLCLAEYHLQHQEPLLPLVTHTEPAFAADQIPQQQSEPVNCQPRICLTSPPAIPPFRPSRPRMARDWRTRRTPLSIVRFVITLHPNIPQISMADI
jgi:hypothetical protein